MTERLYYIDAHLVEFTAQVTAIEADGLHVMLDRTAFYPTSGGQLHDTGVLGASRIVDVLDEETRIVHVCDTPVALTVGSHVSGTVNWVRRFDHMQQHSGQHLLSAILTDGYGWPTLSVHFGDDTNTVDVAAASVDASQLIAIETRVFGAEQRGTLASRMNLANALYSQGKNAEAEQEHRAVLAIQERVLGAEHPDVFQSCYYLALCLEHQKKLPEALAFMQRADAGLTKVLGPEHPDSKDAKAGRERIEGAMR